MGRERQRVSLSSVLLGPLSGAEASRTKSLTCLLQVRELGNETGHRGEIEEVVEEGTRDGNHLECRIEVMAPEVVEVGTTEIEVMVAEEVEVGMTEIGDTVAEEAQVEV
jgi:hypothetical protein